MPLRDMRQAIRPATTAEILGSLSDGMRSPPGPDLATGKEARIPGQPKRKSRISSQIRNQEIMDAKKGIRFVFCHRCFGYVTGRFPDERAARFWAMTYGYQFDGESTR